MRRSSGSPHHSHDPIIATVVESFSLLLVSSTRGHQQDSMAAFRALRQVFPGIDCRNRSRKEMSFVVLITRTTLADA